MIPMFDASQFQGTNISFPQVKAAGYLIGFTRMTYAYPGQAIMIDPTASQNYYGMVSAGILPGGYHKVGWTDPIAEADAFVNAMSPLSKNDGLMYDIEPASGVAIPTNWSEWEQSYVQRVFDRTHTYPFRYLNISMTNSMPKQGIVVNCPSWVAAPSYGWNSTLPVSVSVVIQQGPAIHIPGITANVCDTDMFFGSLEDYLKCTYQPATVTSTPTPVVSTPEPVQNTTPVEKPLTATVTASSDVSDKLISPPVTVTPTQTSDKTNTPLSGTQASTLVSPTKTISLNTQKTSHLNFSSNSNWWARFWKWLTSWIKL